MKTVLQGILCILGMLSFGAQASVVNLASVLEPGNEPFPIQPSDGFGSAAMTLDTDTGEFAWVISFEQLTGPATLAHFHVAPEDASGPVVLNLDTNPGVDFSGIGSEQGIFSGSTLLDAASIGEILSGLWYINIHTSLNPAGEIRGQVYIGEFVPSPVPLPAPFLLLGSGLMAMAGVARVRGSAAAGFPRA